MSAQLKGQIKRLKRKKIQQEANLLYLDCIISYVQDAIEKQEKKMAKLNKEIESGNEVIDKVF